MTTSSNKSFVKKAIRQKFTLVLTSATLALISFGTTFALSSLPASANGCTQGILDKAKKTYGSGYNYMVFNTAVDHSPGFKGIQKIGFERCGGRNYRYWVFKSGTFTRKGDGGYINWAFSGKFNQSGNDGQYVEFFQK